MVKMCLGCGGCCRVMLVCGDKESQNLNKKKLNHSHSFNYRGSFYSVMNSKCRELGDDNKCEIYNKRPMRCRQFPLKEKSAIIKRVVPGCVFGK